MALDRRNSFAAIPQLDAKLEKLLNDNVIFEKKVINIQEFQSDFYSEYGQYKELVAGRFGAVTADIAYLKTFEADIENLEADNATINGKLTAQEASIESLEADNATINGKITAQEAEITNLFGEFASFVSGEFGTLSADVADIQTLMFGSATGTTITTEFANTVVSHIGEAQIHSAMIKDLAFDKITGFDVNTTNVTVHSQDGKSQWKDNTIVIKDANNVTRVQIGKDASNDYNIYVCDANGDLMFDATGVTAAGIKNPIIRNDMVAEDAAINGSKLDIESVFREMDGSTYTLTSNHLTYDGKSLDLTLESMSETDKEQGQLLSSQGTQITAIQGQIASKIWQQDIDTATGEMDTKYSNLEQTLNGFKTEVGNTFGNIDKKADDAQAAANSKRRVFTTTPTPPYDVGDLWSQGGAGEIMVCKNAKTENELYDITDWEKASKYTDDTRADKAYTKAEQTADKFTWIVKSGTSSSNFTLTDRVASLLSSEFQINALTTFKNSAMDGTSTVINGGAIKANTISADKLKVTDLSTLGATIGGFTIDEDKLSNAENPTSILDIGYTQEELKKWPGAMGDSSYIDYQGNMMVGKDNTGVGFYSLKRRGTPPVTISETRSDYKLDLASGEKTDLVSSKLYAGLSGEAVVFVIGNDEMMESWTETWYSHAGFGSQYVEETGLGLTATDATMQAECNLDVTGNITSKGTAVSLEGHTHNRLYNISDSSHKAYVALILDGDYYYFRGSEASKYVCGSEARPWYKTFTENLEVTKGKPVFTYIGSKGGGSTVSYATNMYVGNTGIVSRTTNTSSRTIKHDIAELKGDAIKAENLYNVNVYQAKYNEDILSSNDPRYSKDLPMFIIEDLDEKYPIAVDKPSENVKEWSWNAQYIIPPMLKLIQEQHKVDIIHEERFNQTELRISALQNQLNEAMITIAKQQKQIDLLKAS